jgi:hypothetical protein
MSDDATIAWLLDGDPAIRWQTMRDLTDAPDREIAAQRARVAHEGWGADVLARQLPSGDWGDDGDPRDTWRFTLTTLELLRLLGPDADDADVRRHVALTRDHVRWPEEFGAPPYFDGEEEACINGQVLAQGGALGAPSDVLARRLIGEQLDDGGWNCDAPRSARGSFHSTLCVLEGLLAYERAVGGSPEAAAARARGEEYLLERGLLRRRSTGELVDERFLRFGWPSRWRYDVLRALDHLRDAGRAPDPRLDEALEVVRARRGANGRWIAETAPLDVPVEVFEAAGEESRMITLRALRVLRHFEAAATSAE